MIVWGAAGVEGVTAVQFLCTDTGLGGTDALSGGWAIVTMPCRQEADFLKTLALRSLVQRERLQTVYIRGTCRLDSTDVKCCSKTGRRCLQTIALRAANAVQGCDLWRGLFDSRR